jgi:hypothetical protein
MTHNIGKLMLVLGFAAAVWAWSGDIRATFRANMIATAEAVIGRPATPVSYAGVARRTTVRVATPGVGAPGVGVTRGVGVGAPGVGAAPVNRGGPVNRVGVR